jgi:phosphopantothenoylcysteine decarboxylase/phosphopantothenate--cysteine ligase
VTADRLAGRRILLGVTGGIAAYKAAELTRLLRGEGAQVRVVMTAAAREFVAPLTFQALSGNPVRSDLFDPAHEAAMGHIELARWAELVLIAPASADLIARLAAGLADDLLTTLCLAADCPLAVAPAMNQAMWRHAATQDNVARLAARGVLVWGPAEGAQACGDTGPGRLLEPAELLERTCALRSGGPLAGVPVLLTAGPTREPIDPVRFVGNRSSGKMGFALATALREAGAAVTLVSGPVALPTPPGVARVDVETAAEMHAAVMARVRDCAIFVGCAAVADYRPAAPAPGKIKKAEERLTVELVRNPDILAEVAALEGAPFTVGFAAETERVVDLAEAKRRAKRLDMIAANLVGGAEGGFEADDNALTVLWEGGGETLARAPKPELARAFVAIIARRFNESPGGPAAASLRPTQGDAGV